MKKNIVKIPTLLVLITLWSLPIAKVHAQYGTCSERCIVDKQCKTKDFSQYLNDCSTELQIEKVINESDKCKNEKKPKENCPCTESTQIIKNLVDNAKTWRETLIGRSYSSGL